MGRRRKCRLWWPSNRFSQTPPNSSLLFGWLFPGSEDSLDVVVAFSCGEAELASTLNSGLDLQEILNGANKNMPAVLQDKSKISLVGYFERDFNGNGELVRRGSDRNKYMNSTSDQCSNTSTSDHRSWSCGCPRLDGILEQGRLTSQGNMWIKLVCSLLDTTDGRGVIVPKLDHLHLNDEAISVLDLHVCNIV